MGLWLQDLRYGLRRLAKDRVFAVIALSCLALGIGINAARRAARLEPTQALREE